MYRQPVSPQTQNKRTSSLICGAKRRTGARIATFGLSVLVAGQLMLPGAALAAEMPETVAGQDAAATAVADPAAPVIAKQVAEAPAATADVAASSVMDAEPAAPAAAATESAPAAAQDTAEIEAAVAPADDSTAALAPKSVDVPSAPAAALTRGTANPGGGEIKINTTVVKHFYDLELPPAFTLIQDEAYVYDFPDALKISPFGITSLSTSSGLIPILSPLLKPRTPKRQTFRSAWLPSIITKERPWSLRAAAPIL